jgi:hypothetical protein
MDRAMASLWCGSDLATLSRAHGAGASLQADERHLLEMDDTAMISETLNQQVDRYVLGHLFAGAPLRAYVKLRPYQTRNMLQELEVYERLARLGMEISKKDLRERFSLSLVGENDEVVSAH